MSNAELITCPTWHRPLFRVVPEGIEVKCKFCGGTLHTYSRTEIEATWAQLESQTNQRLQLLAAK